MPDPLILHALAGSLLALGLGLRLAQPRLNALEPCLLGVLSGLAAVFTPALALLPAWLALGLLAVWPKRALAVLGVGSVTWLACRAAQLHLGPPVVWPGWSVLAPMLLIMLLLGAYQVYHGRWWPPLRQIQVGCSGLALLLASATIGTMPAVGTLALLATPLPLWAWWLAKQSQKF